MIDNTDIAYNTVENTDTTIARRFEYTFSEITVNGNKIFGYSCKLSRPNNKKSNLSFFIDESKELGPSDLAEIDYHGTIYCNDEKMIDISPSEIKRNTVIFKMPKTINYISEWILPENLRDGLKNVYLVCNDLIIVNVPGILIKGKSLGDLMMPISEMLITYYCIVDIRLEYSKKSSVIKNIIAENNTPKLSITAGNAYGWSHSRGYLSHVDFPFIKFSVNSNENIFIKEFDRIAYTIIFKKFTVIFEDLNKNIIPINSVIKSIEISHSSVMFANDKIILWNSGDLKHVNDYTFTPKFKKPIFAHKIAHPKIMVELIDNHLEGKLYIIFQLRHITNFLSGTTLRVTM